MEAAGVGVWPPPTTKTLWLSGRVRNNGLLNWDADSYYYSTLFWILTALVNGPDQAVNSDSRGSAGKALTRWRINAVGTSQNNSCLMSNAKSEQRQIFCVSTPYFWDSEPWLRNWWFFFKVKGKVAREKSQKSKNWMEKKDDFVIYIFSSWWSFHSMDQRRYFILHDGDIINYLENNGVCFQAMDKSTIFCTTDNRNAFFQVKKRNTVLFP